MTSAQRQPPCGIRYLQTRDQVVVLFARRGFAGVGLRELAQHLGIRAGSLYNHIESKEVLLFELVEQLYRDLLDVVTRALKSRTTAQRRLDRLIIGYLELHQQKADYFRVTEQANAYLDITHRSQLDTLRERYEHQLFALLSPLGLPTNNDTAQTTVRSIAALLNHLPHRIVGVDLVSSGYIRLLKHMIMGALDAIGIGDGLHRPYPCHTTRHAGPHRAVREIEVRRGVVVPCCQTTQYQALGSVPCGCCATSCASSPQFCVRFPRVHPLDSS